MPQEDFIQVKTAVYAFHRAYEIVLGSSARSVLSKKATGTVHKLWVRMRELKGWPNVMRHPG